MDFFALAIFLGLVGVGITQDIVISTELDVEVPELTEDFFDEILQYLPCTDGSCVYSLPSPEDEVVRRTTVPSYNEFCKEISNGMHDIDDKYPKLKDMKSKLYNYFYISMAQYEKNPDRRKEIAVQVLSEVITLLQLLQKRILDCPERLVPIITTAPVEEIIAEEVYPPFVGSVRGTPGVDYPNYTEVPITSFTCSDKKYIPGFYADLETACQVFHVCYDHRRESFLCPVGTVFNQPILACDYWYSSNCSLAPHYYDVNEERHQVHISEEQDQIEEIITTIIEQEKPAVPHIAVKSKDSLAIQAELDQIFKFLPVKAKVVEFPVKPVQKPLPVLEPKFAKAAVAVPALKVAAKVVPIVKAKIEDAIKSKIEEAVKTKVASKIVPIVKVKAAGVAKAKLAAAAAAAPVVKAKVISAAVPVVKTKIAAAVPIVKTKLVSAAAGPVVKAKVLPVVKTKAAKKVAMISPLTKKALALGYMKLLKAKKLALMG